MKPHVRRTAARRLVQFSRGMHYDAVMVFRTQQNAPRKQILLAAVMALILAASLSAAYAITQWRKPSAALEAILHNPQQLSAIVLLQKLGFAAVPNADIHIAEPSPVLAMARKGGAAPRLFCFFEMASSKAPANSDLRAAAQAFEQQILKSNPGLSLVHEEDSMPLQGGTIYTFENINAAAATFFYVAAAERNGRLCAITYSGASPWTLPDSIAFIRTRAMFLDVGPHNTPTNNPIFKLPAGINT